MTATVWFKTARQIVAEIRNDHVPTAAAAIAFYALLALAPALIMLLTIYSLVTDPQRVRDQLAPIVMALPALASDLLTEQLAAASGLGSRSLTLGLITSAAGLLWTTSTAMGELIKGLGRAYDRTETRGFFHRRLLALALTLGAVAVAAAALFAMTLLPFLVRILGIPGGGWIIGGVRWIGLVTLFGIAITVLYRYGPDQGTERTWLRWGVLVALVLWLGGSAGFSFYVDQLADYQATYGTLAGLAVLMLWLYISAFSILIGAEADAVIRQQASQTRRTRSKETA